MRLPRSSRIATALAALTVTALVPLCGVAQAAPSDTPPATSSAPESEGGDQAGAPKSDFRLLDVGNREGVLGLGILGGVV
ncbi:hypothetical protein SALCHL_001176 [Streptomyces albus subsp. chlorinus]|uniref:hypothetical protein n=1 Tax=Streptomyces albus TaxID=1888 RepID=UPI00156F0839|nr:hypothetical protein [Streptomyces albus]